MFRDGVNSTWHSERLHEYEIHTDDEKEGKREGKGTEREKGKRLDKAGPAKIKGVHVNPPLLDKNARGLRDITNKLRPYTFRCCVCIHMYVGGFSMAGTKSRTLLKTYRAKKSVPILFFFINILAKVSNHFRISIILQRLTFQLYSD